MQLIEPKLNTVLRISNSGFNQSTDVSRQPGAIRAVNHKVLDRLEPARA